MKELIETRELIRKNNNKDYNIETKNTKTGWMGCASFYNDNKTIKVFEGNGDGSDDAEYTYEEFIKKYEYKLIEE